MDSIQLQPLFDYMDEKFEEIHKDIQEVKTDVRELKTNVSNLAGQVYAFQQEMAINTMRSIRMEHWIMEASKKIGIPYNT